MLFLGLSACASEGGSNDTGSSTSAGDASTSAASSDGGSTTVSSAGDGVADAGDDAGSDSAGEPTWACGSIGLLDSGALTWADAALTGSVTRMRVNGVDVDTALDTAWTAQMEHWGPCLVVDGDRVGVAIAMGAQLTGDAEAQLVVGVAGAVGVYDLATTEHTAVADPTVTITCSQLVDGTYVGGPTVLEGQFAVATGTVEVVAIPGADGETLHVRGDGSDGDGFCDFAFDVELTVPDGYFAAVGG